MLGAKLGAGRVKEAGGGRGASQQDWPRTTPWKDSFTTPAVGIRGTLQRLRLKHTEKHTQSKETKRDPIKYPRHNVAHA